MLGSTEPVFTQRADGGSAEVCCCPRGRGAREGPGDGIGFLVLPRPGNTATSPCQHKPLGKRGSAGSRGRAGEPRLQLNVGLSSGAMALAGSQGCVVPPAWRKPPGGVSPSPCFVQQQTRLPPAPCRGAVPLAHRARRSPAALLGERPRGSRHCWMSKPSVAPCQRPRRGDKPGEASQKWEAMRQCPKRCVSSRPTASAVIWERWQAAGGWRLFARGGEITPSTRAVRCSSFPATGRVGKQRLRVTKGPS